MTGADPHFENARWLPNRREIGFHGRRLVLRYGVANEAGAGGFRTPELDGTRTPWDTLAILAPAENTWWMVELPREWRAWSDEELIERFADVRWHAARSL